jgi:hypothetical protein
MSFLEALQLLAEAPDSMKEAILSLMVVSGLHWLVTDGWIQFLFWIVP